MKSLEPRIQSLARADAILSAVLSHGSTPLPLKQLTAKLGLNKTTVFNLAESLVQLGFLERSYDPRGYKLGLRCLELGRHVTKTFPLLQVSQPVLRELCGKTRETVNLAVPYLQEAIIIEALQSPQMVRASAYAGARTHYHSSACGKALLAHRSPEEREWLYAHVGLPRMTPHTICDPQALEKDLADTVRRGFATDRQENEIGAYCIGVPIHDPFGEVIASISVSGVIQRMTPPFVEEVVALLRAQTAAITSALAPAQQARRPAA